MTDRTIQPADMRVHGGETLPIIECECYPLNDISTSNSLFPLWREAESLTDKSEAVGLTLNILFITGGGLGFFSMCFSLFFVTLLLKKSPTVLIFFEFKCYEVRWTCRCAANYCWHEIHRLRGFNPVWYWPNPDPGRPFCHENFPSILWLFSIRKKLLPFSFFDSPQS